MNVLFESFDCIIIQFVLNIIGIIITVFVSGPGDQGSIPHQVILKSQKMVLDASLLDTHHYKVWMKGKWNNPGKVVPSPMPRSSTY